MIQLEKLKTKGLKGLIGFGGIFLMIKQMKLFLELNLYMQIGFLLMKIEKEKGKKIFQYYPLQEYIM